MIRVSLHVPPIVCDKDNLARGGEEEEGRGRGRGGGEEGSCH